MIYKRQMLISFKNIRHKRGAFCCWSVIGVWFALPLIPLILASNQTWFCSFNIPARAVEFIAALLSFCDWESSFPSQINHGTFLAPLFEPVNHGFPLLLVLVGLTAPSPLPGSLWGAPRGNVLSSHSEEGGETGTCFMSLVLLNLLLTTYVATKKYFFFPREAKIQVCS